MENVYYVVELQTGEQPAALVTIHTDYAEAKQKFYQVMAAAAVSTLEKHGCMIVTGDMFVVKSDCEVHVKEE